MTRVHRASCSQKRTRLAVFTCGVFIAALLLFFLPARASAASASSALPAAHAAGADLLQAEATTIPAAEAEEVSNQTEHGEPWWAQLGRVVNFLVLVGVLVYFLRQPVAGYLARRSTEIRGDLVKAAEMREAATAELAAIEERLKKLPAEIEELKARGAREIAAEQARISQAAEAERARLLEQARREIDLLVRAAERDLVRQAADLAVGLAAKRIDRVMTPEDQNRLVDRYLAGLQK